MVISEGYISTGEHSQASHSLPTHWYLPLESVLCADLRSVRLHHNSFYQTDRNFHIFRFSSYGSRISMPFTESMLKKYLSILFSCSYWNSELISWHYRSLRWRINTVVRIWYSLSQTRLILSFYLRSCESLSATFDVSMIQLRQVLGTSIGRAGPD